MRRVILREHEVLHLLEHGTVDLWRAVKSSDPTDSIFWVADADVFPRGKYTGYVMNNRDRIIDCYGITPKTAPWWEVDLDAH